MTTRGNPVTHTTALDLPVKDRLDMVICSLRNFADVADDCVITEVVNSIPAMRIWADELAEIRAALSSPAPERVDEGVKVTKAQAREFRRWLNGDVLQVLLDVSNGIDSPGLVSMARSAIRRVESITAAMRNEHE